MEEIQVGEYIRTKYGIRQIIRMTDTGLFQVDRKVALNDNSVFYFTLSIKQEEILKHSFNIIDLIEVGDYVNDILIEEISEEGIYNNEVFIGNGRKYVSENCGDSYYDRAYFNEDIESVVTKEQFERMKYTVGGKEE